LRVTPIVKSTKTFTFYLQTLTSLFPNPNFSSPFMLATLGGRSSWPTDARSTQGASSLTGSLPGVSSLVQVVEVVHTGLTSRAYRSNRSEFRQPEVSARGHVHV
jgi:hypothetical protein